MNLLSVTVHFVPIILPKGFLYELQSFNVEILPSFFQMVTPESLTLTILRS